MSLDHLPPHKREQIAAIAALIQSSAAVEMLILFGSYARGDWVEDVVNGYFSDFDIMVIVGTEALARDEVLWARVEREARVIGGRVPVPLVVHDIKQINQEIRTGQYFFSDVVNEGVLLFDSRRFMLARPKAQSPSERLEIARRNFLYWFQSANEFWRGAGYFMGRGLGPHAAFLLHQAAERYFHAVLLVFTGYKPKTHDLEALGKQTEGLHAELVGALPRADARDEEVFQLLKRAYIEARYSKSYRVTAEELSLMRERVLDLGRRARRACAEKLGTLSPSDAVGELPVEPTKDEVIELPEAPPSLDDPNAVAVWRDALVRLSYERGDAAGFERGDAAGFERGESAGFERGHAGKLESEARKIIDVLRRRGIEVSDGDAERISACREEQTLAVWWDRAWSVSSVEDLWKS